MADLTNIDDIEELTPAKKGGGGAWGLVFLLLCALGAAGLFGYKERARMLGELATASGQRDEAKGALTAAEAARAKVSDELKELNETLKDKDAKIGALEAQMAQKNTEGESNDRLIADLRSKLDVKDGEVSAESNRVAVNLVDQILFKSGEAELAPRGKEVLGKVGAVLKGLTDKQILIGGHTDDRPIHTERFPSNWELSAARAVNVVHYLVDTAGVDPHRIAAAAYSEFHPKGRKKAKNRRIEILLTPMVEVKPAQKQLAKAKK